MEHRCGERTIVRKHVRLWRAGWDTVGLLTNASLSGAFIRTRLQARILSTVEIEISDTRVPAYVVRNHPEGIGVEWLDFAPAAIVLAIRRIQAERRGDLAPVDVPELSRPAVLEAVDVTRVRQLRSLAVLHDHEPCWKWVT
jgi:hypothetical protein